MREEQRERSPRAAAAAALGGNHEATPLGLRAVGGERVESDGANRLASVLDDEPAIAAVGTQVAREKAEVVLEGKIAVVSKHRPCRRLGAPAEEPLGVVRHDLSQAHGPPGFGHDARSMADHLTFPPSSERAAAAVEDLVSARSSAA